MSHPYIESLLKYRQYRLQAAANRAVSSFLSGPTFFGFAAGTAIGFFSNYSTTTRLALATGGTLLGLAIDMGCRANVIDFLNKHGNQLDSNFRACMLGKKPNDCNFTDVEIMQMAKELLEANKQMRLPLTPQEIFLLPTKVVTQLRELESLSPAPAAPKMNLQPL